MDRVLVFAPHPDDEVIGCGGWLSLLVARGAVIRVVVVTDGGAALPEGTSVATRQQETMTGLKSLGIRDCAFWTLPDGGLPYGGAIQQRYRDCVAAFRPTVIALPHPAEQHIDHRVLTRGLLLALESHWRGLLRFYETTHPCHPINHVEDISTTLDDKLSSVAAHASQLQPFDYLKHCRLLAEMRGLHIGQMAGEAYLVYDWDGSRQEFFVGEPLVSVIVRACDPDLLPHALSSLANQTYPWLEVIVVWFGSRPAPDLSSWSFRVRLVDGVANRAINLNAGIGVANGDLIGFLDEDDIAYPEHVARLVEEMTATPEVDCVYASCRVTRCHQHGSEVVVAGEVELLTPAYEPGRLMFGNYITLHSILLRRQVTQALKFDETLHAYEDWDFLARVEQVGYRMSYVDNIGCEYRLYVESGEDVTLTTAHARKGHTAWRDDTRRRICARMSLDDLTRIETYANRHATVLSEARTELATARTALRRAEQELMELKDAAGLLNRVMALDPSLPVLPRAATASLIARQLNGPVISIVLPVYNTDPGLLTAAVQSIVDQSYPRWQLCIVDDASSSPGTLDVLRRLESDPAMLGRLDLRRRRENGGIVASTGDAVDLARGSYVAFVDHDDLLAPDALLHVALTILERPGVKLMYTDNRMIDHVGNVLNVFEKPDWSPQTLWAYNYINHLTIVCRDALQRAGGTQTVYVGCQDWDLLLRLADILSDDEIAHIPLPLYDWRATSTSVSYSVAAKPWIVDSTRSMLRDRLGAKLHKIVEIGDNPSGVGFEVNWTADPQPVTALIVSRGNHQALRKCLDNLFNGTGATELIAPMVICTVTPDDATYEVLGEYANVRVLTGNVSLPRLVNRALGAVSGELVLFLDEDLEMPDAHWLQRLTRYFDLDDVGAVGPLIAAADRSCCHAGIATDPEWIARELDTTMAPHEAASMRNVSAVSSRCMLTRRSAFIAVGGMDEALDDAFFDVDYCLALRLAGFRIVLARDVYLVRPMSDISSNGDTDMERMRLHMRTKWGDGLVERYRVTYRVAATTRILNMAS